MCRNGEGDAGIALQSSWKHIWALVLGLFSLMAYQQHQRLAR